MRCQRWRLFGRELEALAGREVFYLDECGVERRLHQEHGRAPRGERLYAEVAGSRRRQPASFWHRNAQHAPKTGG